MAGSFFALFDDIATMLDDIASMSKMAFKKTAGVLGDDLALNAEQVSGVKANRELPVVFGVFKGSLINKMILVPLALVISYFFPVMMIPLLMIGGAFLCYEGVETVIEKLFHKEQVKEHKEQHKQNLNLSKEELLIHEKKKIKGAVRTDFILSAEIIVISLNSLGEATLMQKIIALSGLALAFTVFVYGIVALIVRLDDIGFWFQSKKSDFAKKVGLAFVTVVPYLMRGLSFIGLVAMFLVGGGIIVHGIHPVSEFIHNLAPTGFSNVIVSNLGNALVAFVVGLVVVGLHSVFVKVFKKSQKH